jgi:hypothetical protein
VCVVAAILELMYHYWRYPEDDPVDVGTESVNNIGFISDGYCISVRVIAGATSATTQRLLISTRPGGNFGIRTSGG